MEEKAWSLEKFSAVVSMFSVFLLPTITVVTTTRFHTILETSYMWPWMILVRLQPSSYFETDMYNFVLPPWTLIIYLPFIFLLRYAYVQFKQTEARSKISGIITLLALLQIFVIWVVFQSQDASDLSIVEVRKMYYIPQWVIIVLQGSNTLTWYGQDTQKALKGAKPAEKLQVEEEQESTS